MELNKKDFDTKIIGKLKEVFEIREEKTHHIAFKIFYKGKQITKTYRSHGGGEMTDNAIYGVRRQLFLAMPEFKNLKECPLTAEGYKELLKGRGEIKE